MTALQQPPRAAASELRTLPQRRGSSSHRSLPPASGRGTAGGSGCPALPAVPSPSRVRQRCGIGGRGARAGALYTRGKAEKLPKTPRLGDRPPKRLTKTPGSQLQGGQRGLPRPSPAPLRRRRPLRWAPAAPPPAAVAATLSSRAAGPKRSARLPPLALPLLYSPSPSAAGQRLAAPASRPAWP